MHIRGDGRHGRAHLVGAIPCDITERYTMVSENVIEYTATMEDPDLFEEAWTIKMPIYRRLEEGYELPQFKCVEFVEEMMYGRYRKGRESELGF